MVMLGAALIVFREVLEAALIVGIVLAASSGAPRRGFGVSCGLVAGVVGAALLALFAGEVAAAAAGIGQELLNATILLVAVGMLGWHNIWMSRHGRELASSARSIGDAVISGARPLYALAIVVGLAVLREGSETVLFLYGIAAGGGLDAGVLIGGGALGLAGGVAIGAALYFGLLRIPTRRLFTVTSWMVLLLAAGMASQAAGFLVQANLLPPLGDAVWDSSAVLTEDSLLGKALHTLIGYVSRPDGIQLVFYLAALSGIWLLTQWVGKPVSRRPTASLRRGAQMPLLVFLLLGALGAGSVARGEFKIRYPIVDYREVEIEHFADTTFDKPNTGKSNNQRYTNEYGFGPLPNWFIELGTEFQALNGQNITYDATEIESYLQLTPTGKYWGDAALFAEYEQPVRRGDAKSFTFGPLAQTELGEIAGISALHTANLLFTKEVGNSRTDATPLFIAWQSRLLLNPLIEPGVEYYGQLSDLANPGKLADQQHRVGPVLVGRRNFAPYGQVKYEVGYLFGLTRATERGAVRWRLEYEIPF
jgi:high-affinity iron transporter